MSFRRVIVVQGWPETVALEYAPRLMEFIESDALQCIATSEWMTSYKVVASELGCSSLFVIDADGGVKFNGMMG